VNSSNYRLRFDLASAKSIEDVDWALRIWMMRTEGEAAQPRQNPNGARAWLVCLKCNGLGRWPKGSQPSQFIRRFLHQPHIRVGTAYGKALYQCLRCGAVRAYGLSKRIHRAPPVVLRRISGPLEWLPLHPWCRAAIRD
jgi:hypothetical protein